MLVDTTVKLLTGTVPDNHPFPILGGPDAPASAKLRALLDPEKLIFYDSFTKARANLANSAPDYAVGGLVWDSSTTYLAEPGTDGGYVYRSADSAASQMISTSASDVAVHMIVEWSSAAASFAGFYMRLTNTSNTIFVTLSSATGVRLAKVIGGTTTSLINSVRSFNDGQLYFLTAIADGDDFTLILDDEIIGTATDANALSSNTSHGLRFAASQHHCHAFGIATP